MEPTRQEIAAAKKMAERSISFWVRAYRALGVVLPGVLLIQNPVEGRAAVLNGDQIGNRCPKQIRELVLGLMPKVGAKWVVVSAPVQAVDSVTGHDGRQIVIEESICLLTVLDGPGISHSWMIPLNDNGTVGQVIEHDHKPGEGAFAGISGYGPAVSTPTDEAIAQ